jgi:hypothetical protein
VKYLNKQFSTPANSRAYVDNWDAIFGNEPLVDRDPRPSVSAEADAGGPERGFWSLPD